MRIVCIADAFITSEMMEKGVRPYLKDGDTMEVFFFGLPDKSQMRDIIKDIEARRHDNIVYPEGLEEAIAAADLIIVHLCPIKRRMIEKAPNLKAIMTCRGGLENIDVEDATELGIIVSNNPAHNANAVAEFTVAMILSETRNVARAHMALKNRQWRIEYPNTRTTIKEMHDLTVGIVGFGSIGRLVAHKLRNFGCKILVSDPFLKECNVDYVSHVSFDELLQQSDIVSLHARSNGAIMTEREFGLMKQDSYLINSARSYLVETEAFKNAMDSGKLLGAAIDVFETEPDIPEFYLTYDNITLTNHLGGITINSFRDAPGYAMKNYLGYLRGESELMFWVNKKQLS